MCFACFILVCHLFGGSLNIKYAIKIVIAQNSLRNKFGYAVERLYNMFNILY